MTRRIALLALVAASGCEKLTALLPRAPQTLKSADGTLQLSVPGSWTDDSAPARRMNEQAVLQASLRGSELYAIVLTQPKEEGMDLARFSELTRGYQLRAMKDGIEEGPKPRTINGMKAIAYVLKGKSDKADVVLEHVSVEGAASYHQLVVWTLKENWDAQKSDLEKVIDSFKEIAPPK